MLNTISYSLPSAIEVAVREEAEKWRQAGLIGRIWNRDASVWTGDDEAKWLGWLDIADEELGSLQKYHDLKDDIDRAGFTNILLMGMGGSSLAPEVLAITFGKRNFRVLDSTVPAQVKAVEESLDLERTLFIVASKSGSTLEPNCFKQYFFERLAEKVGHENAGKQFVAITDPGSKMEQVAKADGFRHIIYGEPEIGGRFSALSVFGMIPAAAMGLDVEGFLRKSVVMADACKVADPADNPGAMLGLVLGVGQRMGVDKLTLIASQSKRSVGSWLEQLIAESLGKNGVSIIPIDRQSSVDPIVTSEDRLIVYLRSEKSVDPEQDAAIDEVEAKGQAIVRIRSLDRMNLGQEFLRWEFATAVAGAVMQINPFNQPDVESAKVEARKLTEQYERTGNLPQEEPFFVEDGIALFTDETNRLELEALTRERSLDGFVTAHLQRCGTRDYFAVLAYLEMNFDNVVDLEKMRHAVLKKYRVATSVQFGPRFLHSTGQAFKGGSNSGVFLQITSDDDFDLPVPGQKYTFGTVKAAQARGDFQVLLDRGRRALRVHLGSDVTKGIDKLVQCVRS